MRRLAGRGFEIVGSAQSAREALALFTQTEPDIVLCDINMPVINGLELSRRLKEQRPGVHIIIVTGYREFAYAQQAVEIGIEKYILKPVQAEELLKDRGKDPQRARRPRAGGRRPRGRRAVEGRAHKHGRRVYREQSLRPRAFAQGRRVGGLRQRELSEPGL
jgi:CheY-like chemotaxis protein